MKRILLCMLLVALSVCAFASCELLTDGASEFDADRVTFVSAYNEAQRLGFEGTLEEFIALISGKDGLDGKSAYEIAVEMGYSGTCEEWLASLVGAKGDKGEPGATDIGIKSVDYDDDGNFVITFTDNTTQTVEMPKKEEHHHSFGAWTSYGDNGSLHCENRIFLHACEECRIIEFKQGSYSDHNFETKTTPPTCTSGGYDTKTCEVCGKVEIVNETGVTSHAWQSVYTSDNSFHWRKCENCVATISHLEHTLGDDGICTVCNAVVGATEGIVYDVSDDGTYAMVVAYAGSATRIKIADEYEGLPVKEIYSNAFEEANITSVIIPDSVSSIGYCAFRWCFDLTSVIIPDSVTSIGNAAFQCCGLTSVIIPDSVTSIGDTAFHACSDLTSVTLGDSVTSIGYLAFDGCHSSIYTEYEYGRYLKSGGNPYAVLIEITNKNFSSYEIHPDTKIIANRAFYDCNRLNTITIPDSVTSIGVMAFSGCTSLASVTFDNPNGWQLSNSNTIPSTSLANTSTAAGCLTGYNAYYYWKRS